MQKIILVGLGGFVGAALRYLAGGAVQSLTHSISFPYGTLTVNIVGCFFIGMFTYLLEFQSGLAAEMRLFLIVGILGSFTTFSTFSNETVNLLQDKTFMLAIMNIAVHLVLGLAAVVLGRYTVITLWR